MDRRQKKSREAIFNAFEHLLAKESYSKITVQQIIDAANVGRTTFYAHFETKDALLEEMCTNLFDHVFSDHPTIETSHDFSLCEGDFRTIITHFLYHIGDNGKKIGRLLAGESREIFLFYFNQYLNSMLIQYLFTGLEQTNPKVSKEFLQNHVCGSFVNMVQWWLKNGMKETPEQLAECYLAVIQPIL